MIFFRYSGSWYAPGATTSQGIQGGSYIRSVPSVGGSKYLSSSTSYWQNSYYACVIMQLSSLQRSGYMQSMAFEPFISDRSIRSLVDFGITLDSGQQQSATLSTPWTAGLAILIVMHS